MQRWAQIIFMSGKVFLEGLLSIPNRYEVMNMARKKEQSKASKIFWRIVISAVGIALILVAVGNLSLFFFGESTTADVTKRRYGGPDPGRPISQRYLYHNDYPHYTLIQFSGI